MTLNFIVKYGMCVVCVCGSVRASTELQSPEERAVVTVLLSHGVWVLGTQLRACGEQQALGQAELSPAPRNRYVIVVYNQS